MNILRWLRNRKLRKAQEKYAYWKGRREMIEKQLQLDPDDFGDNPFNRHSVIRAAGKESQMMERVEILLRGNV